MSPELKAQFAAVACLAKVKPEGYGIKHLRNEGGIMIGVALMVLKREWLGSRAASGTYLTWKETVRIFFNPKDAADKSGRPAPLPPSTGP